MYATVEKKTEKNVLCIYVLCIMYILYIYNILWVLGIYSSFTRVLYAAMQGLGECLICQIFVPLHVQASKPLVKLLNSNIVIKKLFCT